MARIKFDYGIDLGTTNSAIALMDGDKLKIIKSERYQKDTTPSRVEFTKKSIRVGDSSEIFKKGSIVGFSEFKRTMGTDKAYKTDLMVEPYNSEQLSAEVLKELKGYVKDEAISAAVVTVPNQFRQNQVDATKRAAELAGFQCCILLQEPIAASMAFAAESESMNGYWIVFDFGGGTFDTALMKVDEGIMKVVDTSGDNNLGGKDIDLAIVDQILIPKLKEEYAIDELQADAEFRLALKSVAETIKITLSSKNEIELSSVFAFEDDNGEEIDFEESEVFVSLTEYEKVVTPIFQKAIDLTTDLLKRNNLADDSLGAILLVGGPTFSQTLRRMMNEKFSTKIDTSIDPMTSVARGAAIFASTCSIPEESQVRDLAKVQLNFMYPDTTVEIEENLGVKIARDKTEGDVPDKVWLEVARGDGGWSSGKVEVEMAEIIEIQLLASKANVFNFTLTDEHGTKLPCEPESITIIQGLKAAKPTLPHSICIDSIITGTGRQRLVCLNGLEKNNTLPAVGKRTFKTQKTIRPGNSSDIITIPIIEGEEGQQSKLNHCCAVVVISGSDLPSLLPEGSDVEITLKKDESGLIEIEAYLPYIDESIERKMEQTLDTQLSEIDLHTLRSEIKKSYHALSFIEKVDTSSLEQELGALSERLDACNDDYDSKLTISEHLNDVLKKVDLIEDSAEWPKVKEGLEEALEGVKDTNEEYGNEETTNLLRQLEVSARDVIHQENIKLANDLLEQIHALSFALIRQDTGLWISYIKGFDDDFHTQQWSNEGQARELLNQAKYIISTQPSRDKLEDIVIELFGLLPNKEQPVVNATDSSLLLS
ncbi:MAG: molecular chaperone DnaK [Francisellaceae bacterium]|jgi:molecular chaperone DnaK